MSIPALRWVDPPAGPAIELLDQTRLPAAQEIVTCADVPALVGAMQRLVVRGAPLLGVAGAYGVALAALRGEDVGRAAQALASARPTAVNLSRGVAEAFAAYQQASQGGAGPARDHPDGHPGLAALARAREIAAQDAEASAAMAAHGLALVPHGARILTHCNTGALVSAGEGTAFAIILAAYRAGRLARLWIDETRPLLQGSRLAAYEAGRAGLPHSVLVDGAAAALMASGQVDLVLTGADRIAADGSVANKVGTYGLAVLARYHEVPFVVAAPVSTVDLATPDGSGIPIEQRPAAEVVTVAGQAIAPEATSAYNPAFDVTPPSLVTAIVTERGVIQPVTAGNVRVQSAKLDATLSATPGATQGAGTAVVASAPPPPTWNDEEYERSRAGRR
ncbi:MAG: S-methyl-5-thioribose-1-phosphate isomerase [Streptosporangiaceae bacterium]